MSNSGMPDESVSSEHDSDTSNADRKPFKSSLVHTPNTEERVSSRAQTTLAVFDAGNQALKRMRRLRQLARAALDLRKTLDDATSARNSGNVPLAINILRRCIDDCASLGLGDESADQSGSDSAPTSDAHRLFSLSMQLCAELEDSLEVDRVVLRLREAARDFQVSTTVVGCILMRTVCLIQCVTCPNSRWCLCRLDCFLRKS